MVAMVGMNVGAGQFERARRVLGSLVVRAGMAGAGLAPFFGVLVTALVAYAATNLAPWLAPDGLRRASARVAAARRQPASGL